MSSEESLERTVVSGEHELVESPTNGPLEMPAAGTVIVATDDDVDEEFERFDDKPCSCIGRTAIE